MRKRHKDVVINDALLKDLQGLEEKIVEINEPKEEPEICWNCSNKLTEIEEKVIINSDKFSQLIEKYECEKCGYLYEISLKVTKNH